MNQITKAALICGSGSMVILISILINMPFFLQIILLLLGLAISVYGVFHLIKILGNLPDKQSEIHNEQPIASTAKKKKRPTSTL